MALALIPARLGSKGIPNKNFKPLYHFSPLERAVACCIGAGITPWVSSDAPNTAKWPFWLDAQAPLHTDSCSMLTVMGDFLARVPGEPEEIILLVQPTQPLREPKHLRAAIEILERGCSQVTSVVETESLQKLYVSTNDVLLPVAIPTERRQDARPTYRADGTVYAFRRQDFYLPSFHFQRGAYGMVIPSEESAPLDTPLDWLLAELRLRHAHQVASPVVPSHP